MGTPTTQDDSAPAAVNRPRFRGQPGQSGPRVEAGAIALVAFVAILFAAPDGLWLDEAISVRLASLPFPTLVRFVVEGEPNMGLFHVLLWPIAQLHPSDGVLRILPVAAGALALGATYLLGCRLFDRPTAAMATGLLAVHGLTTRYATEVRGYSLLVLLTVVCALLLIDAVEHSNTGSRRTGSWTLYALCAVLAVTTHFIALLTIAAQLISLLVIHERVDTKRLIRVLVVLSVATAAVAIMFISSSQGGRVSWIPPLSKQQIVDLGKTLSGGTGLAFAVVGTLAVFGSIRAVLAVRASAASAWPDTLLLCSTWIPLAAGVIVSAFHPLLLPRYFVAVLPPLALLVARGVLALPRRPVLSIAATVVLFAVVAVGHPDLDHGAREGTDEASEYVLSRLEPGDAIFLPYNEELPALQWYGQDQIPATVVDARPGVPADALTTDWWWDDSDRFGPELARLANLSEDEWRAGLRQHDRVWVLSGFLATNPRFYDTGTGVVPEGRVECDRQWFEGIDVVLWARSCD